MTGNDFVKFMLRSPLHIFMGKTMLITVTGRKSGRKYTTPVGYSRKGDTLWVITSRDRTWWRNLRAAASVQLRLHGRDVQGFAEAILDEETVAAQVGDYLQQVPMAAKAMGIRVENGQPNPEDGTRLAKERLFIKIKI